MPEHPVVLELEAAVRVRDRTPSPAPATTVKFHELVGPVAVCRPVCAPDIWTQRVSGLVWTFSVTRPPVLAYTTLPTIAVLLVPLQDVPRTVAAEADGAAPMRATPARAVVTRPASSRRAGLGRAGAAVAVVRMRSLAGTSGATSVSSQVRRP